MGCPKHETLRSNKMRNTLTHSSANCGASVCILKVASLKSNSANKNTKSVKIWPNTFENILKKASAGLLLEALVVL